MERWGREGVAGVIWEECRGLGLWLGLGITPVWDQGALQVFQSYFSGQYYRQTSTAPVLLVSRLVTCMAALLGSGRI